MTRVDIISIGTLSRNRLWNESQSVRTAHATTALIRSGNRNILVDPGLPAPAINARLFERTGLSPDKIDTVFLTNFRPSHRAGLPTFASAKLLMHETEQQFAQNQLEKLHAEASAQGLDRDVIEKELEILQQFEPAEDKLAPNVDLFPLFGYTPGNCGLLVSLPTMTILIAGDAVPTRDHFLAGQILPDAMDVPAAQESLQEVYEIADLIVPGHDNIFMNPRSQGI